MFMIYIACLLLSNLLYGVKSPNTDKELLRKQTLEIQQQEAAGEKIFNDQCRSIATALPRRCYSNAAILVHLHKRNGVQTN